MVIRLAPGQLGAAAFVVVLLILGSCDRKPPERVIGGWTASECKRVWQTMPAIKENLCNY